MKCVVVLFALACLLFCSPVSAGTDAFSLSYLQQEFFDQRFPSFNFEANGEGFYDLWYIPQSYNLMMSTISMSDFQSYTTASPLTFSPLSGEAKMLGRPEWSQEYSSASQLAGGTMLLGVLALLV
uniref:Uncharacterized protein n=2 Tax=Vannella robusta TaxID=1487602 RepID=A0A7S4I7C7_9EUKA|mmetsp:Transcript_21484/g.27321  ORF Transcript_21484/g.27321 Transcript_21484/m.27321 type:complete len:125 (+) Transcript_21484:94-468(+)